MASFLKWRGICASNVLLTDLEQGMGGEVTKSVDGIILFRAVGMKARLKSCSRPSQYRMIKSQKCKCRYE